MAHAMQLHVLPSAAAAELAAPRQARFSPYNNNEGTTLAISGTNYSVIAGDTRMSDGYNICSREVSKVYQLAPHCVLASAGMQADFAALRKQLDYNLTMYKHRNDKDMNVTAVAQLLSNTLYYKRFFPYYAFNCLAGIDKQGAGAVYGYDAVGSFERVPYVVTGSGRALITSILDNQVGFLTQSAKRRDLSVEEVVDLVKDCFAAASERDIYTGDSVEIAVITKEGIKYETMELRKD